MSAAPRPMVVVLAAVTLWVSAIVETAGSVVAQADSNLPMTVPSVQDWRPGGGGFALSAAAQIRASPELASVAQQFATDLAQAGRGAYPVVIGGQAQPGELALRIDPAAPDRPESYRIDIGTTLSASARTRQGAISASQTMLQWLRQTPAIAGGTVQDWPDYPERGLMLDVGREFLTVAWVKQRIRELAYYRMNTLHLHLSDTGGFRVQSDNHPEVTSPQHYSKDDIREIISYAAEFGVEVVPEIGFPGHTNGFLTAHPELKLQPVSTSPADAVTDRLLAGSLDGRMDLTNPRSYSLIEDILREFIPLFPGRYFHIGGDEYVTDYSRFPQLAEYAHRVLGPGYGPEDVPAAFFDWANAIVRSYGKTTRIWNDGIAHDTRIPVDASIVVDYWTAGGGLTPWIGTGKSPGQFVDEGRSIQNAAFTPTYFATGGYATALNTAPELLYAWNPSLFINGQRLTPAQHDHLLGAELHIWCDDPTAMTEDQITAPLLARLPIMAQQLWSGTGDAPYPVFADRVQAAGLP